MRGPSLSGIEEALWDEFEVLREKIEKEAPRLLPRCWESLLPYVENKYRWDALESKMEGYFQQHPEWTPRRVAEQVRYYQHMPNRMRPLLIKLAQKVRKRLLMRQLRNRGRSQGSGSEE